MNVFLKSIVAASFVSATMTTVAATATPAQNISADERAKIESVVNDYLMKKPEVIIQAVQNFQRKQYEQAEQTVKKTQAIAASFAAPLFRETGDPVAGNPQGKISVVEFFDYQCPHCVDMAPTMEAMIKANPDVRFVFKEFPIRGPKSELAAKAAIAAHMQGKYYEFSHALLSSHQPISEQLIEKIAKAQGLDYQALKKAMTDNRTEQTLKKNAELAKNLKLFGTPAFFIGKTDASPSDTIQYVPGRMEQNQLQDMIDKAKQ